jgi:excisionase family DNA binding protein
MTVPKALADKGLLSTAEVAKQLGVHRSTVWNWIRTGLLPSVEVASGNGRPFHGVDPKALKRFRQIYPVMPKKKVKKNG